MLLEVNDVRAGYGEMEILRGVSIAVNEGEIVSIVGPNGAGKTTLLKAVFGLVKPTSGNVVFHGRDITGVDPNQLVPLGMGFVPQSDHVFPSLSVHENLEMGAFISKEDMRDRIDYVYDIFEPLKYKRRQRAGTLSGGQQQMVAIGRALILEPALLLLDEPTAGLSPLYSEMILAKVQEINGAGLSVLMIEQNARAALEMSHRGYVLATGENRYHDTGRALLDDRDVAQLFLGG